MFLVCVHVKMKCIFHVSCTGSGISLLLLRDVEGSNLIKDKVSVFVYVMP